MSGWGSGRGGARAALRMPTASEVSLAWRLALRMPTASEVSLAWRLALRSPARAAPPPLALVAVA